jgi:hypothetical protein
MIIFTAIQYHKKQAELQIHTTLFNKKNSNSQSCHHSSTYKCPSIIQINSNMCQALGPSWSWCNEGHWLPMCCWTLAQPAEPPTVWISIPQSSCFYPVPPDVTASKLFWELHICKFSLTFLWWWQIYSFIMVKKCVTFGYVVRALLFL